jgi:hypothetical protein
VSLDIQAILTVFGRRKNSFNNGEVNCLDLKATCLEEIDFWESSLEGAILNMSPLEESDLYKAHLEGTNFVFAYLAEQILKELKILLLTSFLKWKPIITQNTMKKSKNHYERSTLLFSINQSNG